MITVDLDGVGEWNGVLFPAKTGVTYGVRVCDAIGDHLSMEGVFVPIGAVRAFRPFDYMFNHKYKEEVPWLPDRVEVYGNHDITLVNKWLEWLDAEDIMQAATLDEYDECLSHVKHRYGPRVYGGNWVPVKVDTSESGSAHRCWVNALTSFSGQIGVLVHDCY